MAEDKLSINIRIDERSYPMKILRQDEEKIRKAAEMINERVSKYKSKYSNKEAYDYLAMATLHFATSLVENDTDTTVKQIKNEITQINSDIDVYMKQNFEEKK